MSEQQRIIRYVSLTYGELSGFKKINPEAREVARPMPYAPLVWIFACTKIE